MAGIKQGFVPIAAITNWGAGLIISVKKKKNKHIVMMLKTVVLFFNGEPAKTYFCDAPRPSNCHRGEDLPSSSIPFFFLLNLLIFH